MHLSITNSNTNTHHIGDICRNIYRIQTCSHRFLLQTTGLYLNSRLLIDCVVTCSPCEPSFVLTIHRSPNQSTSSDQDRAGPSELQSFSESLKSRLNAVSMRYKESISKNTRSWKDRFFSRSTSMADIGSEVKREVSAGIATVSRLMERLETRENGTRPGTESVSENNTNAELNNEHSRR
ncbi:hypothetical protein HID58_083225 [Brassica napus]|uniref:E3 ubiquitin-protein ligase RHF2A n=1 Tax=Brassica napus TaxID=3708 RepID=A0ABQ7YCR6_BRANA|nr:hypothetical protein HID58_083225 [Brassica napus]